MFPFINEEKKIIFWWSAKCGCSTVKSIMLEIIHNNDQCLSWSNSKYHKPIAKGKISLQEAKKYINVLFIRDPYKRFVSGVIDKSIDGELTKFYKPKSFMDAIENIDKLDVYRHHFAPQTTENFIEGLDFNYIYDIEYIDYKTLSKICNYNIQYRKKNASNFININHHKPKSYLMTYEELEYLKHKKNVPCYTYFYSPEIKEKINKYYYKDFILFQKYNFYYDIPTNDHTWNKVFIIHETI